MGGVQGDVKMVFWVTLLPRHAELDSASSYPVMLNSIQHLKDETLKQVQGDVRVVFRVTLPLLRHAELDSASQKRDPETSSG